MRRKTPPAILVLVFLAVLLCFAGTTLINLTSQVTGTLATANGGLGVANPTAHGILVGEGSSPVNPISGAGCIYQSSSSSDPTVIQCGSSGTFVYLPNSATNSCVNGETVENIGGTAQLKTAAASNGYQHTIGVAVSGCSTTGSALIQTSGLANALFAGSTTAGDFVNDSDGTNGALNDSGIGGAETIPYGAGAMIGIAQTTNTGGGTYQVLLLGNNDIDSPIFVYASPAAGSNGPVNEYLAVRDSSGDWEKATTTDAANGNVSGISYTGGGWVTPFGVMPCQFDGSTTSDDFVIASTSTAGECHDTGSTLPPFSGDVVGRAYATNSGAGVYAVQQVPPHSAGPRGVGTDDLTGQTGAIGTTNVFTPAVSGLYRICGYYVITHSGSSGNLTVQFAFTAEGQSSNYSNFTNAMVGSITSTNNWNNNCETVYALATYPIAFGTSLSGTAGSLTYALHIRVEAM